jgi:hypothetical protein
MARQVGASARLSPVLPAGNKHGYLIQTYRAGNGPGGAIHEAHSPAANVNWLQRDDIVQNPYLGKSGLHFGTFVS